MLHIDIRNSAIKKKETLPSVAWMDLKNTVNLTKPDPKNQILYALPSHEEADPNLGP